MESAPTIKQKTANVFAVFCIVIKMLLLFRRGRLHIVPQYYFFGNLVGVSVKSAI